MTGFTVSASANTREIARRLGEVAQKQIPFATANALTAIAKLVKQGELDVMAQRIDMPTKFTMNSLYIKAARKTKLEARVWFKDYASKGTPASKYMMSAVHGGARRHKRFEKALIAKGIMQPSQFAVPADGAVLDGYGNVPRALHVKLLSGLRAFGEQGYDANASGSARSKRKGNAQKYFAAEIDGTPGIWERDRHTGGVKPLFVFSESEPKYRVILPFFKIAENIHKANYEREFTKALEHAIRTAR